MTDTRLLVPEHRRLSTTAALFGNAFPFQIEPAAYYWRTASRRTITAATGCSTR